MTSKQTIIALCLFACVLTAAGAQPHADEQAVSNALSATLGPYRKAAVFINAGLDDLLLQTSCDHPSAAVIVVPGQGKPTR
jgi:hypothetical protein